MSAINADKSRGRVEAFTRKHRIALLTMLFTDVVGSTQLKQLLGDRAAIELIQRHHALIRELVALFPEAEEIDTAGDSFFIVFAKPSDAAHCALLMQTGMRRLQEETGHPVLDRIGIHVGEVFIQERGEAIRDLFGIQIDTTARVMSLGGADQILLSRFAFDSARQILRGFEIPEIGGLTWLNHGYYEMKGVGEPIEVCEVGETGLAALAPPKDSDKAHRFHSPTDEPVLGWRPAAGQLVPNTRWLLEKNLGEGGFGEVWLARHEQLKQERVIKFCFNAERARSLKREVTLFRLLRKRVGEHPNIVAIHDVFFDEPPFYIVMDYVEGPTFDRWVKGDGGADEAALEIRLEVLAQVADALQAAHDSGIIHRDVKPTNILVEEHNGAARAKLTDFGIGRIVNAAALAGITGQGFTHTLDPSSSGTGTRNYMAPELLAGEPATTRSDIYSLGVILWQTLTGDFSRPLTGDWPESVADPLLREDIRLCVAGDPQKRFAGAAQLATRLRALRERRATHEAEGARIAVLERRAYRLGLIRAAVAASAVLIIIAGLAIYAFRQARAAREMLDVAARSDRVAATESIARGEEGDAFAHYARAIRYTPKSTGTAEAALPLIISSSLQHSQVTFVGHTDVVRNAVFSQDGRRFLTSSNDKTARLWEAHTGKQLALFQGHTSEINRAVFSPDGRRVLTASDDNTARLWEAETGKELLQFRGHTHAVNTAFFNPAGTHVLTSAWDSARLWDAKTGKELVQFQGHTDQIRTAVFSPDGHRVLTASSDNTARLWDADSGQQLSLFQCHAVVAMAIFSHDGRTVLTSSGDGTTRLWDADTTKELMQLRNSVSWIAVFSPDGRRVLTDWRSGNVLRLWAVDSGKELVQLQGHSGRIRSAVFSPDGQRVLTASADKTARLWDANTGKQLSVFQGHTGSVADAIFNADGTQVVTASADKTVRLWDADTSRGVAHFKADNRIESAVFTPDGSGILVIVSGQVPTLRHVDTGLELTRFQADDVHIAVFSPNGQSVLTACDDSDVRVKDWTYSSKPADDLTVRLWDVRTGKELPTRLEGHTDSIRSMHFSADGRRVVTASRDKTARVWDARTGSELLRFQHNGPVYSAILSPDERRVLTVSDDETVRLWDPNTRSEVVQFRGHTGSINSAIFNPAGLRVLTASADKTARLWDAATGRQLALFQGHTSEVNSAAFSPDGRRVLTASDDNTARLWETDTGREVAQLRGHTGKVYQAVFSADGRRVLTASLDRSVRLWPVFQAEQSRPDWLGTFLTWMGGKRIADDGHVVLLTDSERGAMETELHSHLAEDNDYARLLRWRMTPPRERPTDPYGTATQEKWASAIVARGGTRQAIEHAYALDPQNPLIHLALAGFEKDSVRAAFLREYHDPRRLPPDAAICARAAEMLRKQKQTSLALEIAEKAVAADGKHVEAQRQLAGCLSDLNRAEPATAAYNALLAFPEATAEDWANAGYFNAKAGNHERAREIFDHAVTRFPNEEVTFREQGWAFINFNSPAEALAAFRRSESLAGKTPRADLLAGLVVAQWLTGDKDAAVRDYVRLISVASEFADADKIKALGWTDAETAPLLAALAETLLRHPELVRNKETER